MSDYKLKSWFDKNATRQSSEQELATKSNGSFMVRPSSKNNCLTITYKTMDGVVVHILVEEDVKTRSFTLQTDPDTRYACLEDLLESLHLKIPEREPSFAAVSSALPRQQSGHSSMQSIAPSLLGELSSGGVASTSTRTLPHAQSTTVFSGNSLDVPSPLASTRGASVGTDLRKERFVQSKSARSTLTRAMSSGTNLQLPRELTYFEKEKIKKDCKGIRVEDLVDLLIEERQKVRILTADLRTSLEDKKVLERTVNTILVKTRNVNLGDKSSESTEQLANEMSVNMFEEFWSEGDTTSQREEFLPQTEHERNMLTTLVSYVPRLVNRRLTQIAGPIVCPASERFHGALLFADISGFTPLTERMGKLGQEGVEKLTTYLNQYFTKLVGLVNKYGGDIVKYAGDAILAQWPTDHDLFAMCMMACQCGLELQRELHNYPVPGGVLTLHSGVGCGELTGLYVGGINNRIEYLIDGPPLAQVSSCEKEADKGEIYISPEVHALIKQRVKVKDSKDKNNYKLEEITYPIKILALRHQLPLLLDMQQNLAAFLPGAVQHQIRNSKTGKIKYLGELRSITTVFCNLSLEYRGINDLAKLQDAIVAVQKQLDRFEGTLRQFIVDDKGCVLIAVWGLPPLSHENDPERAVEAALGMIVPLLDLGVRPSIGITTGRVFCGDVGCEDRREYAVVGDVVNLSARLMAAAKQGILCDELTYQNALRKIEFHALDAITVKGKAAPIKIFRPIKRVSLQEERTRRRVMQSHALSSTAHVGSSPVIGRKTEIALIAKECKGLKDATDQTPTKIMLMIGEAGVGKTRLVQELIKLSGQPQSRILAGDATEMDKSTSFHAWKDMMSSRVMKLIATLNGAQQIGVLGPHPDVLKVVFEDIAIAEDPKTKSMSGQARAERLHKLMLELVARIATPGTLLVIDSAQWLDSASWSLLANVCATLPGLLVCIAMRPVKNAPVDLLKIEKMAVTTRLVVEPLTNEEDTAALIRQWSQLSEVPKSITEQIHKKAQGNPFVTQEMVQSLMEFVDETDDKQRVLRHQEALAFIRESMPRTVQALITSKIDRLSADQQVVLKFAAVIGMSFSVDFLYKLLPQEQITRVQLEKDLETLTNQAILNQVSSTQYAFVNSFLHEGVYNLMLFAQKRALHARIAQMIEQEHGGTRSYYATIALHAKNAEEYELAYRYYLKAGSAAVVAYQNDEATAFFLEALDLVQKTNLVGTLEHVTLERKLGMAFVDRGCNDRAQHHLRSGLQMLGIELADDKTNERRLSKAKLPKDLDYAAKLDAMLALGTLARLQAYECQRDAAHSIVHLAMKIAKGNDGLREELYSVAIFLGVRSDKKETLNVEEYIELYRNSGKAQLRLPAEMAIGAYCMGRSRWIEADVALRIAYDTAVLAGDRRSVEEALCNRSHVFLVQGNLVESIRCAREALESARRRGDVQIQLIAATALGRTQLWREHDSNDLQSTCDELQMLLNSATFIDMTNNISSHAVLATRRARQIDSVSIVPQKDVSNALSSTISDVAASLELMEKAEPTTIFQFLGYSLIPEVLLRLLLSPRVENDSTRAQLSTMLDQSLGYLQKYSEVFTCARPRSILMRALWALMNGKKKDVEKYLKEAHESAVDTQMLYDQALSMLYRGAFVSSKETVKLSEQARDTFKSMGIVNVTNAEQPPPFIDQWRINAYLQKNK